VSPVPLTATASGDHVLVATTRSKSTLRTVAAELAADDPGVDYFPSYEVITGAPARMAFFEDNLRSVRAEGVATVMGHFFRGLRLTAPARHDPVANPIQAMRAARRAMRTEALKCEEAMLDVAP
jgi:DNA-binding IclR family transcriptional regulator